MPQALALRLRVPTSQRPACDGAMVALRKRSLQEATHFFLFRLLG
jgi:hypothetical protein